MVFLVNGLYLRHFQSQESKVFFAHSRLRPSAEKFVILEEQGFSDFIKMDEVESSGMEQG